MVLLDTNVFIIDRFFPRDDRNTVNRAFLTQLSAIEAAISIFSLFELCGISSFNLSSRELKRWMYHFDEVYTVTILEPQGLGTQLAAVWFQQFSIELFNRFERKMTWGDAVLLHTAEEHDAAAIVSWNKKHFENRSTIRVFTPAEYTML